MVLWHERAHMLTRVRITRFRVKCKFDTFKITDVPLRYGTHNLRRARHKRSYLWPVDTFNIQIPCDKLADVHTYFVRIMKITCVCE